MTISSNPIGLSGCILIYLRRFISGGLSCLLSFVGISGVIGMHAFFARYVLILEFFGKRLNLILSSIATSRTLCSSKNTLLSHGSRHWHLHINSMWMCVRPLMAPFTLGEWLYEMLISNGFLGSLIVCPHNASSQ